MAREFVKCGVCQQQVHVNERVKFTHTSAQTGKSRNINAHPRCAETFQRDYLEFGDLRETILRIWQIPQLDDQMVKYLVDIRNGVERKQGRKQEKRTGYTYGVMNETLLKKEKDIINKLEKGWRYCFAIMRNGLPDVHRDIQKLKEKSEEVNKIVDQDTFFLPNIDFNKQPKEKKEKKVDITKLFH